MINKTICFIIFGSGKGNGGHYRSLSVISNALKYNFRTLILNIGYTHSPIIQNSGIENYFIKFNGLNIFTTLKNVYFLLNSRNLYVIHCFDYQSLLLGKMISRNLKIPVLYTMCGGASPRGYFPNVNYVTVFSLENYKYFKKLGKFMNSKIWYIPNRVDKFVVNDEKINFLIKNFKLSNKFIFLRICRISHYYLKSLIQAIHLTKNLTESGFNVCLLIIGNVQDGEVYMDLVKIIADSKNIYLVTEDFFTLNAKELIDISNFVIGTGRGFMEACSRGKIMLVPSNNSEYPVLINSLNFEEAFHTNFSERTIFSDEVVKNNYNNIVSLLNSQTDYKFQSDISYDRFLNYFSIDKGVQKYIDVYSSLNYIKISNVDLFLNWVYFNKKNMGNWFRNFSILFT